MYHVRLLSLKNLTNANEVSKLIFFIDKVIKIARNNNNLNG